MLFILQILFSLIALIIPISEQIIETIVLTPYAFLFLGASCLVGGISQFKEEKKRMSLLSTIVS